MIRLTLPWPVSANRYWATRIVKPKGRPAMAMTYVTAEAKAYKAQAELIARAAGIRAPLPGRVMVHVQLYPKRPQDWAKRAKADPLAWDDGVRCIDLDNARKVTYDALKGIVFLDDDRVFRDSAERMEPDGEGRVVVLVQPYEPTRPRAQACLLATP